jgi:virginiamycin B lyase
MKRSPHVLAVALMVLGATFAANGAHANTTGRYQLFPLPTPTSNPISIVAGPDGNLWFTENSGARIGRITTSGTLTEFSTAPKHPIDITVGPDGALWFTEAEWAIGRITTGGAMTQFPLPPKNRPLSITTGSDGDLWFTVPGRTFLRTMTTQGVLSKVALPQPVGTPQEITSGPDGDVWFTIQGIDKIGRADPVTDAVTEYELVDGYDPADIHTGPDGNMWFTCQNEVGTITMEGQLSEYAAPFQAYLGGPVTGSDGNLWITMAAANALGRMDPADPAHITKFQNPNEATATDITPGSDGRLWIAFGFANAIAAVTV